MQCDAAQELPLFYGELVGGTPQHAADRTWLLRLLLAGLQVHHCLFGCSLLATAFHHHPLIVPLLNMAVHWPHCLLIHPVSQDDMFKISVVVPASSLPHNILLHPVILLNLQMSLVWGQQVSCRGAHIIHDATVFLSALGTHTICQACKCVA